VRTSWDDLATVALLGTARRRADDVPLPEPLARAAEGPGEPREPAAKASDPAARLLDVAALATVYLRSGLRAGPPRPLPPAAPADPRPVVGAAARARLAGLLAATDRELLTVWLVTAAERGLKPPAQALPALLDLAVRHPRLAPAVVAACGPRGRWLAGHRPHWAQAVRAASPPCPPDDAGAAGGEAMSDGPGVWQTGTPPERLAWLRAHRGRDRTGAGELLAAAWAREAPAERAALLAVLADGLGPDDEALLERGLADRRADVRAVAARLLTALPGSALAARATERGRHALRIERQLLRRRLVVRVPAAHDAAMARDQVPPPPAQLSGGGTGPGAWLLLHVVAATPLRAWTPALGDTAADVVPLDVPDGWCAVVWSGWARAAVRERDAGWAAALLDHPPAVARATAPPAPGAAPGAGRPGLVDPAAAVPELLALLPVADRSRYLAEVLESRVASRLPASVAVLLQPVPAPWERPLAGAVLGWLHRRSRLDDPDGRAVLDLAARRLPEESAGALRAVADRWPPLSPSRRYAAAAADLMTVRREMLEELQ
jgi:hypothetical protein